MHGRKAGHELHERMPRKSQSPAPLHLESMDGQPPIRLRPVRDVHADAHLQPERRMRRRVRRQFQPARQLQQSALPNGMHASGLHSGLRTGGRHQAELQVPAGADPAAATMHGKAQMHHFLVKRPSVVSVQRPDHCQDHSLHKMRQAGRHS